MSTKEKIFEIGSMILAITAFVFVLGALAFGVVSLVRYYFFSSYLAPVTSTTYYLVEIGTSSIVFDEYPYSSPNAAINAAYNLIPTSTDTESGQVNQMHFSGQLVSEPLPVPQIAPTSTEWSCPLTDFVKLNGSNDQVSGDPVTVTSQNKPYSDCTQLQ